MAHARRRIPRRLRDRPAVDRARGRAAPLLSRSASFAPTGAPDHPRAGDPAADAPGRHRRLGGRTDAAGWTGPSEDGRRARGRGPAACAAPSTSSPPSTTFWPATAWASPPATIDPVPAGSIVLGDPGLVLCRGALVEPGVVFDTRGGAVVLERGAEVRHGARLEGPLYVGERSPGSWAGTLRLSRIRPPLQRQGRSHQHGLPGLCQQEPRRLRRAQRAGALGEPRRGHHDLESQEHLRHGRPRVDGERIATGRQFLGSLIGDHAKTAIGTLLSTGTVVGAGANVFGAVPAAQGTCRPWRGGATATNG